jgi:hypothetical protein
MTNQLMSLENAIKWIKNPANKGLQFEVKFIKKNGDPRIMKCEAGYVSPDLVKNPYNPGVNFAEHNLVCVWDTEASGYRSFSKDRLLSIKANDVWFDIEGTIEKVPE